MRSPLSEQDLSLVRVLLRNALSHPRSVVALANVTNMELRRATTDVTEGLQSIVSLVGRAGQHLEPGSDSARLLELIIEMASSSSYGSVVQDELGPIARARGLVVPTSNVDAETEPSAAC